MNAPARRLVPVVLTLWLASACSIPSRAWLAGDGGRDAPVAPQEPPATRSQEKPRVQEPEEEEEAPRRSGRPFLIGVLLYLPNRVLDLLDVARAGVEVGPGVGLDLTATEYLRLGLMARTSAGVGYETLRHLPVKAAGETYLDVGPLGINPAFPLPWYRNTWDLRVEAHVLLVGAHVAVNPAEIADAILGLTTFDLMDDDY